MFEIRLGIPEVYNFWKELKNKVDSGIANKNEVIKYKKLGKTFRLISENPRYPGLNSHEIKALSLRYGMKVFESYVENKNPSAGRVFWVYGPNKEDITIIGIEPHPNDKSNAYEKISLSNMEL